MTTVCIHGEPACLECLLVHRGTMNTSHLSTLGWTPRSLELWAGLAVCELVSCWRWLAMPPGYLDGEDIERATAAHNSALAIAGHLPP